MLYSFFIWLLWKVVQALVQVPPLSRWTASRVERRKEQLSIFPLGRGPPGLQIEWPFISSVLSYKYYAAGLWVLVRR